MFTLIYGTMMSGKSSTLINYISSTKFAKKEYIVFYPSTDTRTHNGQITSRTGANIGAIQVDPNNIDAIYDLIGNDLHSVFIDEIQFFNKDIIDVAKYCIKNDINLFVSGLLGDVNGEVFETVAALLPYATKVIQVEGVCKICGAPSTMVIRRIDEVVDHHNNIIIEGTKRNVKYYDVCAKCFINAMEE